MNDAPGTAYIIEMLGRTISDRDAVIADLQAQLAQAQLALAQARQENEQT